MNEARKSPSITEYRVEGAVPDDGPIRRGIPRLFHTAAACLFSLLLPITAESATLHVSQDGDGTDGLTWETAFTKIGDALTASATGAEIWVASGTYRENIEIAVPVSIYGGFEGNEGETELERRDWRTNETVVAATEQSSTIKITAKSRFDGFTISGRHRHLRPYSGGGLRIRSSEVDIRNCIIQDNLADEGAGVWVRDSIVYFNGCNIQNNDAYREGGGAWIEDSTAVFLNCRILDNYGSYQGGGVWIQ